MASKNASSCLRTGVSRNCVLGSIFKRSEAGLSAGTSTRFDGKKVDIDMEKRVVVSRATRRASRSRRRRALAVKARGS